MSGRHDWQRCGRWGIVFGVSTCRKCGRTARDKQSLSEVCEDEMKLLSEEQAE